MACTCKTEENKMMRSKHASYIGVHMWVHIVIMCDPSARVQGIFYPLLFLMHDTCVLKNKLVFCVRNNSPCTPMLEDPVETVSTRKGVGPDACYFYLDSCPVKDRSASDSASASGLHVKRCKCELKIRENDFPRYLEQVQRHMILFHGNEGNFADPKVFKTLSNDLKLYMYKPRNALETMREQHSRVVIPLVEIPPYPPPQPPLYCRPPRTPEAPPRRKQSPSVHQFYILYKALEADDNEEKDDPSAFDTCCSFLKNLMTMEKDLRSKALGFYNLSTEIDDVSQKDQKESCVLVSHGCQALYRKFNDFRKTFQKNAEQLVAKHAFLHANAKPCARHLPTQAMTMLPKMLQSLEDLWQGECEVQHGAGRTPELKQLNLKKISIKGDACAVCADWHVQHMKDREKHSCRQRWIEHVQKEHFVSDIDDDEAWQYCRAYIAQSPEIRPSKKRRKSYDQGAIDVSLSSESDTAGVDAGKKKVEILRRLKTLCCESPCEVDDAYLVYDPVRSPQMLQEADDMLQDAMEASIVVASCLKTVKNKGMKEVDDWIDRCLEALQQYRQSAAAIPASNTDAT